MDEWEFDAEQCCLDMAEEMKFEYERMRKEIYDSMFEQNT